MVVGIPSLLRRFPGNFDQLFNMMMNKEINMVFDSLRLYNRTRWTIYVSLFVGYSTYYLARMSYTFAKPALIRDLNFDKSDLGVISSGFAVCYGLSKFAGGLLADRMSSRTQFSVGLFLTGVLNIVIGFSNSLWLFTVLWSANGFFQGCGWPPCAKLLRVWFLPTEVGTLWSLLSAGCNLATSISPLLTIYLTTTYGWSAAFTLPGFLALSLSGMVYFSIHDHPSDTGLENSTKEGTNLNTKSEDDGNDKTNNVFMLLRSPFLWMLCSGYLLTLFLKAGVSDWTQLYLMQTKQKSEYDASVAMSMFQVGGLAGSISSGYLSDRMVEKYGTTRKSSPRVPVIIGFVTLQIFCLHLLCDVVSPISSLGFTSLVIFGLGFAQYGPINIFGVLAVECAPPRLTGTSHAIVALAANIGAVFGGYPLTTLSKYYDWDGVFLLMKIAAVLMLIGLVCARNLSSKMVDTARLD